MTESGIATGGEVGLPPRFADDVTELLGYQSKMYEQALDDRKRRVQQLGQVTFGSREWTKDEREVLAEHPEARRYLKIGKRVVDEESYWERQIVASMKAHVLWPWLEPLKGLTGPRTGRLMAAIGDPWRFPGQQCSNGHTFRPVLQPGSPCPLTDGGRENDVPGEAGAGRADASAERADETGSPRPDAEGATESETRPGVGAAGDAPSESETPSARCPGVIQPPRRHALCLPPDRCGSRCGFGCRSMHHYLGLIPGDDGRLIRRRKGVQTSYSPQLQSLVLGSLSGPDGIGKQIRAFKIEPYITVRNDFKARRQAVAESGPESEQRRGDLPAWRIERQALLVAAKAFLGDLLVEWKRRTPLEQPGEGEQLDERGAA